MKPLADFTGRKFGRLAVIERVLPNHRGNARWRCLCDCGVTTVVVGVNLRRGNTTSCGCLTLERGRLAATTHGMSKTRIYGIWCGMMKRCYNPSAQDYSRYGGRGITICERWREFENFYADMGDAPKGLTLERKNNNGPYEPGNCEWATRKQQGRNRSNVHSVILNGATMTIAEACERLGLKRGMVYQRIHRGASPEKALGL